VAAEAERQLREVAARRAAAAALERTLIENKELCVRREAEQRRRLALEEAALKGVIPETNTIHVVLCCMQNRTWGP
jgi:hypothetical protein